MSGQMIDVDGMCAALEAQGLGTAAAICKKFAAGSAAYCSNVVNKDTMMSQQGAPAGGFTAQRLAAMQQQGGQTMLVPVAPSPAGDCGCGCGGKPGGCGGGGACGLPPQRPIPPSSQPVPVPVVGGGTGSCLPGTAQVMPPKCYDCSAIDPCLQAYLYDAQLRLDPWAYEQLRINELPIVNIDKFVGAAPYVNFPLAAGASTFYAQADVQILPFRPAAVKAQPEWTGQPANSKVTLTFYSGPSGLTNITSPNTAGLVKIGQGFKLSNFTCFDDCYYGPFPEFESCRGSAIPYQRSIYVEIVVGAVGQSVLNGIGLELIKAKTYVAAQLCGNFKWFCA